MRYCGRPWHEHGIVQNMNKYQSEHSQDQVNQQISGSLFGLPIHQKNKAQGQVTIWASYKPSLTANWALS